jgi:hypothetical protein
LAYPQNTPTGVCPRCGTTVWKSALSCHVCGYPGAPLPSWRQAGPTPASGPEPPCPRCATPLANGVRFCPRCGLDRWSTPGAAGRGGSATPHKRGRGAVIVAVSLIGLAVVLAAVGATENASNTETPDPGTPARATYAVPVVTYLVTGTAGAAGITYTNSAGNVEQSTNVAIPLRSHDASGASVDGLVIHPSHGSFVQIMAQNNTDSGTLDCSILYDGRVINTGHASGGYAIATCSATIP